MKSRRFAARSNLRLGVNFMLNNARKETEGSYEDQKSPRVICPSECVRRARPGTVQIHQEGWRRTRHMSTPKRITYSHLRSSMILRRLASSASDADEGRISGWKQVDFVLLFDNDAVSTGALDSSIVTAWCQSVHTHLENKSQSGTRVVCI